MDEVGRSDAGNPRTGDASGDDARHAGGATGDRGTPSSSSAGSPPFTYPFDTDQLDDDWSIPDWTAAERADRTWSASARVRPLSVEPGGVGDASDASAYGSPGAQRIAESGSHAASDPTDRYGSDPYPPAAVGRATNWYGQATARGAASVRSDRHAAPNDQPAEPADAPRRYPTRERHPSDPYGFAPIDPTIDPLSDAWVSVVEPLGAGSPVDTWSDPLPDDRRPAVETGASAGSHAGGNARPAPGADSVPTAPVAPVAHAMPHTTPETPSRPDDQSEAWEPVVLASGARGSVPLTDALTAETIEAPLFAAARARPYGEPVFSDLRHPHVLVPRPRASDLHPLATEDRSEDNSSDAAFTTAGTAVAEGRGTEAPDTADTVAASGLPADLAAGDGTEATADARRAAMRAAAPGARTDIPDVGTAAADVRTPAADVRTAVADVRTAVAEARPASDVDARIVQRAAVVAASDHAAAIPMPAGPSETTNASGAALPGPRESVPITPAPIAQVPTGRPVDDGPRLSREPGGPSPNGSRGADGPPAPAAPMPPTSERDSASASSAVRPDIRRRSSWLRTGGSGRAGRFGGRPISMFTSSTSEGASSAEPDKATAPDTAPSVAPGLESPSAMYAQAASGDRQGHPPTERRDSWDQAAPVPSGSTTAAGSGSFEDQDTRRFIPLGQPTLPHRVPAMPDVPFVEPSDLDDADEGVAHLPTTDVDGPELSRIASRLRHDEESVPELPEELDVAAVLAAVRQVHGVRSAQLRPNPGGVHILRLDLADDADAGRVSRQVARLLKERMGLAAEPRRSRTGTGGTAQGSAVAGRSAASPAVGGPMPRPGATAPPAGATMPPAGATLPPAGAPVSTAGATSPAAESQLASASNRPTVPVPGPTAPGRQTTYASAHVPSAAPGFRPVMPGEPGTYVPGGSGIPAGPPLDAAAGQLARIVLDQVHVSTLGTEATVEVRLHSRDVATVGKATGPAVDAYLLRLAAQAAAGAIDSLIATVSGGPDARDGGLPPVRCFIEHAGVVPFGTCVVAVVVVLASGDGRIEQLVGSALVAGDPRQAIVRATLAAVNRRLESLLA